MDMLGTQAAATAQQIGQELESIPLWNDVLRQQLTSIVAQSEQAALDIVQRLQDLDRALTQLHALTDTLVEPSASAAYLAHSRQALAVMLMEALASVQFQDALRQQVQHIIQALHGLDRHTGALAQHLHLHLHRPADPLGLGDRADLAPIRPLTEQLQELYNNYVMSAQRQSHHSAVSAPSHELKETEPKIELF